MTLEGPPRLGDVFQIWCPYFGSDWGSQWNRDIWRLKLEVKHGCISNRIVTFQIQLVGGLKYFLCSPRSLGRSSKLTHIFQMGWNHQPDVVLQTPFFFPELNKQINNGWKIYQVANSKNLLEKGRFPHSYQQLIVLFFATVRYPYPMATAFLQLAVVSLGLALFNTCGHFWCDRIFGGKNLSRKKPWKVSTVKYHLNWCELGRVMILCILIVFFKMLYIPYHPWDWYIYAHLP